MQNNGTETLVQNRVWKKNNRLTFIDNRTLRIDIENNKKSSSYRIDVIALNARYKRQMDIAWPWLTAAVLLMVLLLLESKWQIFLPADSLFSTLSLITIGILSLACLAAFFKLSHSKHVFRSHHAKVPLVEVWAGIPSRKVVDSFLKLMEQRIDKAHHHMNLSEQQQLTGEMKMLRRLVEENILQQSIYEKAKKKLFNKF